MLRKSEFYQIFNLLPGLSLQLLQSLLLRLPKLSLVMIMHHDEIHEKGLKLCFCFEVKLTSLSIFVNLDLFLRILNLQPLLVLLDVIFDLFLTFFLNPDEIADFNNDTWFSIEKEKSGILGYFFSQDI